MSILFFFHFFAFENETLFMSFLLFFFIFYSNEQICLNVMNKICVWAFGKGINLLLE